MLKFNKIIIAGAIAATGIISTDVSAGTTSPHTFSVGVEGFHYKYREPGLMEDNGRLYGINGDYFYNFTNNWFLGTEARVDWGTAHYKSKSTGRDKNIKQFLYEQRLLFGYTFKNSKVNTSLFSGLGYRFKSDYSGGKTTTTGHFGYDRDSQYVYLPLGVKFDSTFNENWDWQATTELDILLCGRQKSYLNIAGQSPRGLTHKQKSGVGVKLDFMVGYKLPKGKISFGPFFNYWDIDKSNVVLGTVEPHNRTIEAGLKAKWGF